jgi:hypothetical protein
MENNKVKGFASEIFKQNFSKIIKEKYGVDNPSQSKELQDKRAESMKSMFEKKGIQMNRYTYETLVELCKEKNITLLQDYSKIKVNKETKIEAKCLDCTDGIVYKGFSNFCKYPYCIKCNEKRRQKLMKENNIKKYGVEHTAQVKEVKEKIKKTCIKKYGVENPSQNKEIQHKKEETSMKNYGTKSPMQNKELKKKIKEKFIEKYGVENPSQVPEISEKQNKRGYQIKLYTFPSGRKVTYQGYENFVLDKLINENKVDENDIETSRKLVPELWYNFNGIRRRHFVDIYIKSRKLCIEVKSTWTLEKHYEKVFAKQKNAKEKGFKYIILIVNNKGDILETYK